MSTRILDGHGMYPNRWAIRVSWISAALSSIGFLGSFYLSAWAARINVISSATSNLEEGLYIYSILVLLFTSIPISALILALSRVLLNRPKILTFMTVAATVFALSLWLSLAASNFDLGYTLFATVYVLIGLWVALMSVHAIRESVWPISISLVGLATVCCYLCSATFSFIGELEYLPLWISPLSVVWFAAVACWMFVLDLRLGEVNT